MSNIEIASPHTRQQRHLRPVSKLWKPPTTFGARLRWCGTGAEAASAALAVVSVVTVSVTGGAMAAG